VWILNEGFRSFIADIDDFYNWEKNASQINAYLFCAETLFFSAAPGDASLIYDRGFSSLTGVATGVGVPFGLSPPP